jgi:hypothetical protein
MGSLELSRSRPDVFMAGETAADSLLGKLIQTNDHENENT